MTGPDVVRLPGGRRAHLWYGGSSSGPAVFFQHGCPDTRLAARGGDAAAHRLGIRLVAVSRPGYGSSDPAESGHLSVADDTVAVADLLGITRFAVLGMSVGGTYALACAARHPERVTAVGVVASPADVPALDPPWHRDDLSEQQQQFYRLLAETPVPGCVELLRPEFEAYVTRVNPHDPDDVALAGRWTEGLDPRDAQLLGGVPARELAASARESLLCPEGYLRDAAVTFRRWEFDPDEIACPVALRYGALDRQVSVRNGEWLEATLPDATYVVRPDDAHLGTLVRHWDELLETLVRSG